MLCLFVRLCNFAKLLWFISLYSNNNNNNNNKSNSNYYDYYYYYNYLLNKKIKILLTFYCTTIKTVFKKIINIIIIFKLKV